MSEKVLIEVGWPRLLLGLSAAALAAWLLITAKDFASNFIGQVLDPVSYPYYFIRLGDAFQLYVAVGIPIALVVVFFIGIPVWAVVVHQRERRKAVDVARAGAKVGFGVVVACALFVVPVILLSTASVGISNLPAYLWIKLAIDALSMVAAGAVAALVAWTVSGAASRQTSGAGENRSGSA